MFIPKIPCYITKVGNHDLYGQEAESDVIEERCHVVRLRKERFRTTLRADASASQGRADEPRADVIILLKPDTVATLGDRLTVDHISIRIHNVDPRFSVMGVLHHYEVRGELWE